MSIETNIRLDGYTDLINALADRNKLEASLFSLGTIPDEILRNQYKKNKIFAKTLDIWVEQALKHELEVQDKYKPVYDYIKDKDMIKGLEKALKINNLFGSSLMVLLFKKDKPEKLQDPIKTGDNYINSLSDIVAYKVYEKSQIIDKKFNSIGEVESFQVSTNTGVITYHSSRCIWFNGEYKTEQDLIDNNYFGYSIMTPSLYEAINNYTNVNNMLPELLADSNISVNKIKDLNRRLASKNDAEQKAVIEKVRLSMMARSFIGTMLLDSDDEFQRFSTANFAGVFDLIKQVTNRLVAESKIPHTFLLGEAPESSIGGQSGTSQERIFYDAVKTYRYMNLNSALTKLFEICAAIKNISMKRVKGSVFEFKELYQPTELEKAQEEKLDAEEDKLQAETLKTTLENIKAMNELGLNYIVDEEGEVKLIPSIAVINNQSIIDTSKYEVIK